MVVNGETDFLSRFGSALRCSSTGEFGWRNDGRNGLKSEGSFGENVMNKLLEKRFFLPIRSRRPLSPSFGKLPHIHMVGC